MKVESAQLSGRDYTSDLARKMYDTVQDIGWDGISADIHSGPRGERFTVDVRLAGVSAGFSLAFPDRFALMDFLNGAKYETSPSEKDATDAYRALAFLAQQATQDDGTPDDRGATA